MAYSDYTQAEILAQIQAFFHLKDATAANGTSDNELSPIDGQYNEVLQASIGQYLEDNGLAGTLTPGAPDFYQQFYRALREDIVSDPAIAQRLEEMAANPDALSPEERQMLRAASALNGFGGDVMIEDRQTERNATAQAAMDIKEKGNSFSADNMSNNMPLSEYQTVAASQGLAFLQQEGLMTPELRTIIGEEADTAGDYRAIERAIRSNEDAIRARATSIVSDPAMAGAGNIFMMQAVLGMFDPAEYGTALIESDYQNENSFWEGYTLDMLRSFTGISGPAATAEAAADAAAEPGTPVQPDNYTAYFIDNVVLNRHDYSLHSRYVWNEMQENEGLESGAAITAYIDDYATRYEAANEGQKFTDSDRETLRARLEAEIGQLEDIARQLDNVEITAEQIADTFLETRAADATDPDALRAAITEYEAVEVTRDAAVQIMKESWSNYYDRADVARYVAAYEERVDELIESSGDQMDNETLLARAAVDVRAMVDEENGVPGQAIVDENHSFYQGDILQFGEFFRNQMISAENLDVLYDYNYGAFRRGTIEDTVQAVYTETAEAAAAVAAAAEAEAAEAATAAAEAEAEAAAEAAATIEREQQSALAAGETFHENNPFSLFVGDVDNLDEANITAQAQTIGAAMAFYADENGQLSLQDAATGFHQIHDENYAGPLTDENIAALDTLAAEAGLNPAEPVSMNDPRVLEVLSAYANGTTIDALPAAWREAFAEVAPAIEQTTPEPAAADAPAETADNDAVAAMAGAFADAGAQSNAQEEEIDPEAGREAARAALAEKFTGQAAGTEAEATADDATGPETPPPLPDGFAGDMNTAFADLQTAYIDYLGALPMVPSPAQIELNTQLHDLHQAAMTAYENGDPVAAVSAMRDMSDAMTEGLAGIQEAFVEQHWDSLAPYLSEYGVEEGDHAGAVQALREHQQEIIDATYSNRGADVRELLRDRRSFDQLEKPREAAAEIDNRIDELAASAGIPEAAPAAEPAPEAEAATPSEPDRVPIPDHIDVPFAR